MKFMLMPWKESYAADIVKYANNLMNFFGRAFMLNRISRQ